LSFGKSVVQEEEALMRTLTVALLASAAVWAAVPNSANAATYYFGNGNLRYDPVLVTTSGPSQMGGSFTGGAAAVDAAALTGTGNFEANGHYAYAGFNVAGTLEVVMNSRIENRSGGMSNIRWFLTLEGPTFTLLQQGTFNCYARETVCETGDVSLGSLTGVPNVVTLPFVFWMGGNMPNVADPDTYTSTLTATPVPIPGAFALFGAGLVALAGVARRERKGAVA
jgi:hypothetical protein